jgi:hypothetical protein
MTETLPPEPPGGVAGALGTLRHALADPLSAAGLKLEILERRLASALPGDPSLADRVRGAKADLAVAGRLIDLLPRMAAVAGEAPAETSLGDLCRAAGLRIEEGEASRSPLRLRRLATIDALRSLAGFVGSRDPGGAPPEARAEAALGRVSLRIEAPCGTGDTDPDRPFGLPRGGERAEDLFLARVGVESDGGRADLGRREGRLVVLLSWPVPPAPGGARAPS